MPPAFRPGVFRVCARNDSGDEIFDSSRDTKGEKATGKMVLGMKVSIRGFGALKYSYAVYRGRQDSVLGTQNANLPVLSALCPSPNISSTDLHNTA